MADFSLFKPSPISQSEYHDHDIINIALPDSRNVIITTKSLNNTFHKIRLINVRHFYISNLMPGNIISYVVCHKITHKNSEKLLKLFSSFENEYISIDSIRGEIQNNSIMDHKFVSFIPSYGADIFAIVEDVTEETVDRP